MIDGNALDRASSGPSGRTVDNTARSKLTDCSPRCCLVAVRQTRRCGQGRGCGTGQALRVARPTSQRTRSSQIARSSAWLLQRTRTRQSASGSATDLGPVVRTGRPTLRRRSGWATHVSMRARKPDPMLSCGIRLSPDAPEGPGSQPERREGQPTSELYGARRAPIIESLLVRVWLGRAIWQSQVLNARIWPIFGSARFAEPLLCFGPIAFW